MATNYNLSPQPQAANAGRTAFGLVPGTIGKPPNLYQGIESVYPGLGGLTTGAGRVIGSQIRGELSPETINTIQDEAASFGVASGLPSTNFSGYRGLRNLGLNVEATQRSGVDAYNRYLSSLAPLMDQPEMMASIASQNAVLNAAPDPTMAYRQLMADYDRYMGRAAGAGTIGGINRGPAGGTGQSTYRPPTELPGGPVFNSLATDYNRGPDYVSPEGWQRWRDEASAWAIPGKGTSAESYNPWDEGGDWWNEVTEAPYTGGSSTYDPYAGLGGWDFEGTYGG
jgi:hypothetical protein